ncbi:MAG: hypothetical protein Q9219_001883 [cf. Caloplaca sp. 3 TL-2023]
MEAPTTPDASSELRTTTELCTDNDSSLSTSNPGVARVSLDSLSPELQAQIMCDLDSMTTLHSLIRASPRFYQVFRARKEYLLTQLIFQRFNPGILDDVWNLALSSQCPDSTDTYKVWETMNSFRYDPESIPAQLPLPMIIPLCKLLPSIQWFVQDIQNQSFAFLGNFVTQLGLTQDPQVLSSELSAVERGRIQRALCRFETYRHLFAAYTANATFPRSTTEIGRFLRLYDIDGPEEIACIRDYVIRRLWNIFKSIEDDALAEKSDEDPIRAMSKQVEPFPWLSYPAKSIHTKFMEHFMSKGLSFLQKIFESSGLERADLVIRGSKIHRYYLSDALPDPLRDGDTPDEFDDGPMECEGDFLGDELENLAQGLFWANRGKVPLRYGRQPLQGLRQWGYMFWDKQRLEASGVMEKDPKEVAQYKLDRTNEWSVQELLDNPHLVG